MSQTFGTGTAQPRSLQARLLIPLDETHPSVHIESGVTNGGGAGAAPFSSDPTGSVRMTDDARVAVKTGSGYWVARCGSGLKNVSGCTVPSTEKLFKYVPITEDTIDKLKEEVVGGKDVVIGLPGVRRRLGFLLRVKRGKWLKILDPETCVIYKVAPCQGLMRVASVTDLIEHKKDPKIARSIASLVSGCDESVDIGAMTAWLLANRSRISAFKPTVKVTYELGPSCAVPGARCAAVRKVACEPAPPKCGEVQKPEPEVIAEADGGGQEKEQEGAGAAETGTPTEELSQLSRMMADVSQQYVAFFDRMARQATLAQGRIQNAESIAQRSARAAADAQRRAVGSARAAEEDARSAQQPGEERPPRRRARAGSGGTGGT
jgi:hypothetical protein